MNLRLHRLAVEEIDHEVDYYESIQPGLGVELEEEIDAALDAIVRFPRSAPPGSITPSDECSCLRGFHSHCRTSCGMRS